MILASWILAQNEGVTALRKLNIFEEAHPE
jgi:hypothetical protein